MKKKLLVMINCDTDPIIEPTQDSIFQKDMVWEGTIRSLINLKNQIKTFKDYFGNSPRITWFLRSDWQTYNIWGDWCYPAKKYMDIWQEFKDSGDEIGWHPHLWKFDHGKNIWYQEIYDNTWIRNCLENGYNEISKIFDVKSVRMGWNFHNNYTMDILSSIGIKYDLSALPGIMNINNICRIYDWSNTPSHPYFPSRNNYMIEDKSYSNILKIMEIPITTYILPKYLQILTGKKIMAINIAKNQLFFRNVIKSVLHSVNVNENNEIFLLNAFFHPSDITGNKFILSLNNFKKSLSKITTNSNIEVIFTSPQEFIERWRNNKC